jgi:catechol 2,3-dioxygenase-like lactoylglutathione lyase family enzyme
VALPEFGVGRIARLSLTSANADRLSIFYESALGFRRMSKREFSAAESEALTGVRGGAHRLTLQLGREILEILQFDSTGRPYPAGATAADIIFQHFAIVVADMEGAYRRLLSVPAWTPISTAGPQQLPQSSGGVTAFKFRDPEGHPLELLAFPEHSTPLRWRTLECADLFLGIDHSAISVRDTARACDFYRGLGLRVSAQTVNRGPEQESLDGLPQARVRVTALAPPDSGPHLELLCYDSPDRANNLDLRHNDVATTRIVLAAGPPILESQAARGLSLCDPDGHYLQFVCARGLRHNR